MFAHTVKLPIARGPTGNVIIYEDLLVIRRWVAERKAEAIAAIRAGVISKAEFCERHFITPEEIESWERIRDGAADVRAFCRGNMVRLACEAASASPNPASLQSPKRRRGTVIVWGTRVQFTGRERCIVELLHARRGLVITKPMLMTELYAGSSQWPMPKIIDIFLAKIRKKIRRSCGRDPGIKTVWGRGYVLDADGFELG